MRTLRQKNDIIPVQLTADSWCYTCDQERVGEYGIPKLNPVDIDFSQYTWIGYNYATGIKPTNKKAQSYGVHFFVGDYIFKHLYTHMDKYTQSLSKFGALCTPEFSAYLDYPKVLQIYSLYRSYACGQYWQKHGLKVIPTVYWEMPDSWEWCFDGCPQNSCVAVGTTTIGKSKGLRKMFKLGFDEMMRRLHPTNILWYGEYFEECEGPIFHIPNYAAERWRGEKSEHTIIRSAEEDTIWQEKDHPGQQEVQGLLTQKTWQPILQ